VKRAPWRVVLAGGDRATGDIRLTRTWAGGICRSELHNAGRRPVGVQEVVLFDIAHTLPGDTRVYGEGFQMLTQSGGTLAQPQDLGNYTDSTHYKIPQPEDTRVVYGLVTMAVPDGGRHFVVVAFTSARRFVGRFYLRASSLQVVVDTEGLSLEPGERWTLEECSASEGPDRDSLLANIAQRLAHNHPPLHSASPPTGWCSWYCFGPRVTARQVLDNLDTIARHTPGLRYIQIDDGYQPAMGDWLDTGSAFGGDIRAVLDAIRGRGFEPAIWVAPFIAEEQSQLFRRHPDWFVQDRAGQPLRSDRVTFGGWRHGPWYAVDGTHPAAQAYLERVFHTMRSEWGCSYFKLDANFWGAIHGGRFHDARATRVEAYRRGMEAIRRGAGDAFLLGCNHPIWPSLGLIHGSRSSNDIKRTWERVATTARQNLSRNWQNGRLWWNDPDAVVLTGDLTEEEIRFHATAVYASGGMILSGDDLTAIPADRLAMLRALQPPTGVAARFTDDTFGTGTIDLPNGRAVCLLNWNDKPQTLSVTMPAAQHVRELWTGEDQGRHNGGVLSRTLPAHSGRVLLFT
jgi:alpha-galactosidase